MQGPYKILHAPEYLKLAILNIIWKLSKKNVCLIAFSEGIAVKFYLDSISYSDMLKIMIFDG